MSRTAPKQQAPEARPVAAEGDLLVLPDGTEWAVLDVVTSTDHPTRYEIRTLTHGCTQTRNQFQVERALAGGGRVEVDGAPSPTSQG